MKTFPSSANTSFWFTLTRYIRISLFWGLIIGFVVTTNAIGTIKAGINLNQFAASLSTSSGLFAIFGSGHQLNTIEGYVTWKVLGLTMIIMAIWGLVISTTLFRGNEESGRIELMAIGKASLKRITINTLAAIAACIAIIFIIASLITYASGNSNGLHFSFVGSLLLSFACIASAIIFVSLGALCGQLFTTRHQALFYCVATFAIFYMAKIVADSSNSFAWLNNFNPLGWIENIQPFTGNYAVWILPILGFSSILSALAIYFSGKRDLASSIVKNKETTTSSFLFLNNIGEFITRQQIFSFLGWVVGVGILGFIFGSVVNAGENALSSSPNLTKEISKLHLYSGADIVKAFMGFGFLIGMVLVSFIAITGMTKLQNDETSGYLDNLFVRSVKRMNWMGLSLVFTAIEIVIVALSLGVLSWVGTLTQHISIAISTLLVAGINSTAPALAILGIGACIYGIWPRIATRVQYFILGWGILIDLIGPSIHLSNIFLNTSLFYHMALSPGEDPNWTVVIIFTLIGIIGSMIGMYLFSKRDIQSS